MRFIFKVFIFQILSRSVAHSGKVGDCSNVGSNLKLGSGCGALAVLQLLTQISVVRTTFHIFFEHVPNWKDKKFKSAKWPFVVVWVLWSLACLRT